MVIINDHFSRDNQQTALTTAGIGTCALQWAIEVEFRTHFHPYAEKLAAWMAEGSVAALQSADTNEEEFKEKDIFGTKNSFPADGYVTTTAVNVEHKPKKNIDFSSNGAYSVYNWELFYHIPLTIAIHLSRNKRYEEARNWFHYIFDPTDASGGPAPQRFWKVKSLKFTEMENIRDIVNALTDAQSNSSLVDSIEASIEAWKNNPFRPHVVARYRPAAYMYKTIMAYLDNLIAWGDDLFLQDTGESINEAAMFYVLAANILGDRPQTSPRYNPSPAKPKTYNDLKNITQSVQFAAEQLTTGCRTNAPAADASSAGIGWPGPHGVKDHPSTVLATYLSFSPYFCVPDNADVLKYWDTVADRLFKIRNSLNVKGVFRQLPLFEPPIDPALLVRARAAGLDIGKVVRGLGQPLPLVRFRLLLQKAAEICQEVKTLGGNLLSVLEKKDDEAMSILRARHERVVLEMAESVKYGQWQDAIKSREGLEESFGNAVQRYTYYEMLLGKKESAIDVPELHEFDASELERMKLRLREPEMHLRRIDVKLAGNVEDQQKISTYEASDLGGLKDAQKLHEKAVDERKRVAEINQQPQVTTTAGGKLPGNWGLPFDVGVSISYGSEQIAAVHAANADRYEARAAMKTYEAGTASKMGGYERREQEWAFQSNTAAGEITQSYKQLRAAQIREAVAEREWKNHKQQIKHADEIERFLTNEKKGKLTNQAFYAWMKREVTGLHAKCFDLAYDVAKKAERALQHELGDDSLSFLQFGYTAGKEGLFAGEKLHLDIKRMEMAYHEMNEREYELTKHVSLLQVDPMALVTLRTTGQCVFSLSEELFDFDGPGHYFRRIKSVSLSIPCVAGPYAGVNCRLTLQRSRIRTSASLAAGYAENTADSAGDLRFQTYRGRIQSVVTSSGQGDSGLFETNLNDERYLPFENSGVIATWELKLPGDPSRAEPCPFDYDTISDVVLHIRYTAREGGDRLRGAAMQNLRIMMTDERGVGAARLPLTRMFSVRHEFPTEWAAFKASEDDFPPLVIPLREEHYPYWSKNWIPDGAVTRRYYLARSEGTPTGNQFVARSPGFSERVVSLDSARQHASIGEFNFANCANDGAANDISKAIDDLWIALTWTGA